MNNIWSGIPMSGYVVICFDTNWFDLVVLVDYYTMIDLMIQLVQ